MRFWIILSGLLVLLGCETMPKPRASSEYLFSTNKATNALFGDLRSSFEPHKYKIEKQDDAAGILLMAPRVFSFESNGKKIYAHQYVQLRQEGGSLKLRLSYDCNYLGDEKTFVTCYEDDQALGDKVDRLETAFVEVLKPALHSDNDRTTASAHLIDDIKAPGSK